MIEKLLALTKSETGLITGIFRSKKFGLVGSWVIFCGVLVSELIAAKEYVLAMHALYCGTGLAAIYVAFQSWVEGKGFAAGVAVAAIENGNGNGNGNGVHVEPASAVASTKQP